MMATEQHPDANVLSDYALGRLPVEEIEFVADHIDECVECQQTLSNIDAREDTLLRGLVAGAPDEPFADEWEAVQLQESELKESADVEATAGFVGKASDAKPEGGSKLRDYHLLEKLGAGGMGAVYRARHERLDRLVALKLLPIERTRQPQAVARFHREMKAVGNLDHPNIVRAYDAGEVDGKHFLAMELVDGVDLSALVDRDGPLAVADACELIRQAAIGLQSAHDNGLVHRDVKPSNLMLDRTGTVKVLDLGLARVLGEDVGDVEFQSSDDGSKFQRISGELTGTDQMMGTPDYMAPEQCAGGRVDGRSDVYSLGATLYKLLAGHAPYSGSEYDTLAKKVAGLTNEAPSPPILEHREDIPPALVAVLNRMLSKDREARFATPAEVAEALAPFASQRRIGLLADGAAESVVKTSASGPPRNPRRWIVAAAAAGFLFAAVVLLQLLTPDGEIVVNVPPESRDDVQIEVSNGRDVKVLNAKEGWQAALDEGSWDVTLTNAEDHFRLDRDQVTITRGEQQLVEIFLNRQKKSEAVQSDAEVSQVDNTAASKRVEYPVDCMLYTKVYTLDEHDKIALDNHLDWRVMPEYRGPSRQGSVVDQRITIALVDGNKSFWPMIAKFSFDEARSLHANLGQKVGELQEDGIAADKTRRLSSELVIQGYAVDGVGRVALPENVKWLISVQNTVPHVGHELTLRLYDAADDKSPFVARMSRITAERLTRQLGNVIAEKERSVAVERPEPFILKTFTPGKQSPIVRDGVEAIRDESGWEAWRLQTGEARTFRLFEIEKPAVDDCVVTYRAKMRTEDVQGKAYLEMWCRVPPNNEAFSKGFHHAVTGTNGWATYETPFFLKKGERSDLIKLNVALEGKGTVWIKDVEVIVAPLPE